MSEKIKCDNCGQETKHTINKEHKESLNIKIYCDQCQGRGKQLPLRWFKFYVYGYLFIKILVAIAGLFIMKDASVLYFYFVLVTSSILLYGLVKRKKWGYYFNFYYIIFETLITFMVNSTMFVPSIAGPFLWAWLNWIYFKKRKYLFNK